MTAFPKIKPRSKDPVDWSGFAIPKKAVKLEGYSYTKFKAQVLKRDFNRCKRCGKTFKPRELTIHHKIKRSHLRLDTLENAETVCLPCHMKER